MNKFSKKIYKKFNKIRKEEEEADEKRQPPTFETHNVIIKATDVNTEETVDIQTTTGVKIIGQRFSRIF